MKLRIVGDGTTKGTRVETETGELIERVQRIEIVGDVRDRTITAIIKLIDIPIDLLVDAELEETEDIPFNLE